jgi:putative addiction module component (TIGR02574 family)
VDVPTLLNEIDALPINDRAELIEEAWDRLLCAGYDPGITAEQDAEITRRLELLEQDPSRTVSWDAVDPRPR